MKRAPRNILFTIILILYGNNIFAQIDTNAREIPWKPIKDKNILWSKRVWREIPIFEKQNAPLRDDPESPTENVFANILLSGVNAGVFTAFAKVEERDTKDILDEKDLKDEWVNVDGPVIYKDSTKQLKTTLSQPLGKEEINRIISCDPSNLSVNSRRYLNFCAQRKDDSLDFFVDWAGKPSEELEKLVSPYDTSVVTSCSYPQQIDRYGIIEDWIFDKKQGGMVVRIVAITPMSQGKPLFWVPYPEIRRYLARYEAYKGKTSARYTWDEYFESRQFSSKITKVSNPFGTQENKTDY